MLPKPQKTPPPASPPFQWHDLTPDQQCRLSHLLTCLVRQYLTSVQTEVLKEVGNEPSSQDP